MGGLCKGEQKCRPTAFILYPSWRLHGLALGAGTGDGGPGRAGSKNCYQKRNVTSRKTTGTGREDTGKPEALTRDRDRPTDEPGSLP